MPNRALALILAFAGVFGVAPSAQAAAPVVTLTMNVDDMEVPDFPDNTDTWNKSFFVRAAVHDDDGDVSLDPPTCVLNGVSASCPQALYQYGNSVRDWGTYFASTAFGPKTLTVRVTDAQGNTGEATIHWTYHEDTVAPVVVPGAVT